MVHSECLHVPVPPPPLLLPELPPEPPPLLLPPPPQVSPQIEPTSLTHCASHFVVQQYESWLQMSVAQVLQLETSLVPAEQRS